MPILDRISNQFQSDPKFVTVENYQLAFECLAFCLVHMQEHGYVPKCVWLDDDQYQSYTALYPVVPEKPTFFGIQVIASKSA